MSELHKMYWLGGERHAHDGIFSAAGRRLSYWPHGYDPTSARLDVAFALIAAREGNLPLPQEALRKIFEEARP